MPSSAARSVSTRPSRFSPAERVGKEKVYSINQTEEDEDEVEEGVSTTAITDDEGVPLTKSGFPDRRFKGYRDAPPPDVANPEYRRARVGGVMGDTHVTIDGKPDRRFKENRSLSEEEAMRRFAKNLATEYGLIKH